MFSINGVFLLLRICVFHVSEELTVRNGSTFNADETKMLDYMQEKPQDCKDGYTGSNCTPRCRYPSYGRKCQKRCNCAEIFCNFTTGCEACKNGYTGLNCDRQCIYPGFGAGCQSECNCRVEQCDHVKGCMLGFGINNSGCIYPSYGKYCQMTCSCEEMFCNATNGCIVTNSCTSDEHHRNQAMMFSTAILGALAMIQFSVYFYCAWSPKRL